MSSAAFTSSYDHSSSVMQIENLPESPVPPDDVVSPTTNQLPSTNISTTPAATTTSTSFDLLSPIYLTIGPIFVLVLCIMIWLLMVPNIRRPWSCRSHRKETTIPLRQRGPGDAYEINPDMWRGGGRFVGESIRGRDGTGTEEAHCAMIIDAGTAERADSSVSAVEDGSNGARRAENPPPYNLRTEQSLGSRRDCV